MGFREIKNKVRKSDAWEKKWEIVKIYNTIKVQRSNTKVPMRDREREMECAKEISKKTVKEARKSLSTKRIQFNKHQE